MRYGQDSGNFMEEIGVWGISMGIILLTFIVLRRIQKLDPNTVTEFVTTGRGQKAAKGLTIVFMLGLCVLSGGVILGITGMRMDSEAGLLRSNALLFVTFVSVMAGCLLTACIMDMESCMVYNYVWWVGGLTGMALLYMCRSRGVTELVLFILLQELLFCRMYGRADCHAFVVCAMAETALGMTLKEYLFHMLFAFILLALSQGMAHNIGKNGNLKRPVPFLPYIVVAFWLYLSIALFLFPYVPPHFFRIFRG